MPEHLGASPNKTGGIATGLLEIGGKESAKDSTNTCAKCLAEEKRGGSAAGSIRDAERGGRRKDTRCFLAPEKKFDLLRHCTCKNIILIAVG